MQLGPNVPKSVYPATRHMGKDANLGSSNFSSRRRVYRAMPTGLSPSQLYPSLLGPATGFWLQGYRYRIQIQNLPQTSPKTRVRGRDPWVSNAALKRKWTPYGPRSYAVAQEDRPVSIRHIFYQDGHTEPR